MPLSGKPSDSKKYLERLKVISPTPITQVADIAKVIDFFGYLGEWKVDYKIRSVQSSLQSEKITCVEAAIISYGLLELLFPQVKRCILLIHRRDKQGEECGHCVTLYWGKNGKIGVFSKSSYAGFGHRDTIYDSELDVARSFAEGYLNMGFSPLYYGITTLEEAAGDLDWRYSEDDITHLSERLLQYYQYFFEVEKNGT